MKILYYIASFVFAVLPVASFAQIDGWEAYMSPGYRIESSQVDDAVEGHHVADLEPPLIDFDEAGTDRRVDKYFFGYVDYLFYLQSVDCASYRNKHLHISAYIRTNVEKAKAHIERYRMKLNEQLEASIREKGLVQAFFASRFQLRVFERMLEDTKYDLVAFVVNGDEVIRYNTFVDYPLNTWAWQRANLEIDVPPNCDTISVGTYFQGIGQLQTDGFVVNERGAVTGPPSGKRLGEKDATLREKIIKLGNKYKANRTFRNFGYEQSGSEFEAN